MILRLTVLTMLLALFAMGFSSLVESRQRMPGIGTASAGCLDRGVICIRPAG